MGKVSESVLSLDVDTRILFALAQLFKSRYSVVNNPFDEAARIASQKAEIRRYPDGKGEQVKWFVDLDTQADPASVPNIRVSGGLSRPTAPQLTG
ncbi:MAG: hypothetical protein OSA11_01050 [Candidatus Nanopelagicales bacterium]|nr:hypothetical protein [Candidatus Nanopelagicales bacterium]